MAIVAKAYVISNFFKILKYLITKQHEVNLKTSRWLLNYS